MTPEDLRSWIDPAVAIGTLLLAIATGWLAWRTHAMASATRDVAAQTKVLARATVEMARETERVARATERMLEIEASRFDAERTANLVPIQWDGTNGLSIQNNGQAATILRQAVVAKTMALPRHVDADRPWREEVPRHDRLASGQCRARSAAA